MIARIWHGWTKRADAKRYERLLRDEIFLSIAARRISSYRGAELFVHEDGDEAEFVTLLRFDSMDAVKRFAGADASKPVIFPKTEALITRMEQRNIIELRSEVECVVLNVKSNVSTRLSLRPTIFDKAAVSYPTLDVEAILEIVRQLERRISEQFWTRAEAGQFSERRRRSTLMMGCGFTKFNFFENSSHRFRIRR